MTEVVIRKARRDDDLAALITQLGYPVTREVARTRLQRILDSESGDVFLACIDDAIVGFVHVDSVFGVEYDPTGRIRALVVDEEHRNEHIGERLVEHAEAWSRDHGLPAVIVYSNVIRTRARKFYERLGYSVKKTSNVFEKPL